MRVRGDLTLVAQVAYYNEGDMLLGRIKIVTRTERQILLPAAGQTRVYSIICSVVFLSTLLTIPRITLQLTDEHEKKFERHETRAVDLVSLRQIWRDSSA